MGPKGLTVASGISEAEMQGAALGCVLPHCMQVLIQDAILKWKRSGPSPSLSKGGEESPMHQERELLLEGVPRSGV